MQKEEEIKRNIIVDGWTKLERECSLTENSKRISSFKNNHTFASTTQPADDGFHQRINSSTKLSLTLPPLHSPKFARSN